MIIKKIDNSNNPESRDSLLNIVNFALTSSYPLKLGAGAEKRTLNLNRELSNFCSIYQYSFLPSEYVLINKLDILKSFFRKNTIDDIKIPFNSREIKIKNNYHEYTFVKPMYYLPQYLSWRLFSSKKLPVFFPSYLDQKSLSLVKQKINDCNIVQIETPWPFCWVKRRVGKNKLIILD